MNHLPKISPKLLTGSLALVGLLFLGALNARLILEAMLKAKDIDARIVSEANPRLNRNKVLEAADILESSQSGDLTANQPSVTVEQEGSETPQEKVNVEIENASGVTGAAASLAEVLTTEGYQVSTVSTAPSLQEKTTILYKAGRDREAQQVKAILEAQQWTVGVVEPRQEQQSDIRIVLGRK